MKTRKSNARNDDIPKFQTKMCTKSPIKSTSNITLQPMPGSSEGSTNNINKKQTQSINSKAKIITKNLQKHLTKLFREQKTELKSPITVHGISIEELKKLTKDHKLCLATWKTLPYIKYIQKGLPWNRNLKVKYYFSTTKVQK